MNLGLEEFIWVKDYIEYRKEKPVVGENLRNYMIHRKRLGKPVDARFVGPSDELYDYLLNGVPVVNLLNALGHMECGILFGYN